MSAKSIADLEVLLNSAAADLPKVTSKKMFGCHALWVNENVFALVWKHGSIGVKLPDEDSYQTLMKIKGASPWKAGPMQMSHWVLVPEGFHDSSASLKKWVVKAHSQCAKLEKKANKKPEGKTPKKTTKAKTRK